MYNFLLCNTPDIPCCNDAVDKEGPQDSDPESSSRSDLITKSKARVLFVCYTPGNTMHERWYLAQADIIESVEGRDT